MKITYKAVTSTCTLILFSNVFAVDIGVIPDTNCPANSESISIYMDDEDTRNNSRLTGWVGATQSSTRFQFCRVNGDMFEPLSNNEDYAVLKLSDSCPNNSIEFNRYFDNEDSRNNNHFTGNIFPNSVSRNTNLKFCYFKGANSGMDSFPDIGVEYGVFAPRNFSKSLASGTIYTDDEDNNNANGLNTHGHAAIKAIIYGKANTVLNLHKVETQGGYRYPESTQFTRVSTSNIVAPNLGSSYIEPNFNTQVTRISDRANQNVNNINRHPITKNGGAWNSDSSILKMGYRLYNATTFEELNVTKNKSNSSSLLGSPNSSDIRWSKTDPQILYIIDSDQKLIKVTINNDLTQISSLPLKDFGEYTDISFGNGEGSLSINDRVLLTAKKANDQNVYVIVYDLKNNQVIGTPHALPLTRWGADFDWASLSAKGNYIVVNINTGRGNQGIYRYNINFSNWTKLDSISSHGDLGINKNGQDVYVQFYFSGAEGRGIFSLNLSNGQKTRLVERVSSYGGGHISCQNYKRPGWCYVATEQEGFREVFALKLDGSKTVQRFAQTHGATDPADGSQKYASHVNVSPHGNAVIFETDWAGLPKDTYYVEAP